MEEPELGPDNEDAEFQDAHGCLMLSSMPEEILEHILGFLSPYREMESAKLVSKQWNRVIQSTVKQKKRKFHQCLARCDVQWTEIRKDRHQGFSERGHIGITDRFSHSAAYCDGFMYVFGGCTSTSTTFNDLWSFDLTHRKWVRPVAMGTYPSPKACATMVVYDGNLVLYGGWSHPIPYPLHQSPHYFSELHAYSLSTNRWMYIHSLGQEPEALGGHSASVVGDLMVVFGGSPRPGMGTNNLWVFNFVKTSWTLQPVACDAVPEPRYGQFQTTLDDRHILIMGGCVGQNRVYTDVWLLTLEPSSPWRWTKLTVKCPELGAPQTWCHAACRVNNLVVVVAKSNTQRHTKLVKRVRRRKRQDRRESPESSPVPPSSSSSSLSSSSSSSSSMPARDTTTERFCTALSPATSAGSGKTHNVYIHPKLQPQPKRRAPSGAATTSSMKEMTASPNAGMTKGVSTKVEQAEPGPSTEASPTVYVHSAGQSTGDSEKPSAQEHCPHFVPRSSCPVAENSTAAPGRLHSQREPSCSAMVPVASLPSNSLLALQQRLHRECLNLPDPDNHHHNPRHSRRYSGGRGMRGSAENGDESDDGDDSRDMPEGYFHRLHNRWMGGQAPEDVSRESRVSFQASPSLQAMSTETSQNLASGGASTSGASQHGDLDNVAGPNTNSSSRQQASASSHMSQPLQQPQHQPSSSQFGGNRQFQRREGHGMPSIRPNATSNRQRQLEALQRQEELLRSKSRALAAARGFQPQQQPAPPPPLSRENVPVQPQGNVVPAEGAGPVSGADGKERKGSHSKHDQGTVKSKNNHNYEDDDSDDHDSDQDPSTPTLIPTKNKMDVHVLDISKAVSEHVVRWGPISEFQPEGAPEETICCSLVEGRGELVLFGGVRRDLTGVDRGPAGVSNMAVSKLYLLRPV
ncbi:F-box only protein 42 [Elysia marginata]|uniref:F-box only protein 42 n=1 Tax=Elysia marginata TaxID=1093978 RepID=A0AAV4JGZ6_9GAST|nr:F-box only protein 42 [Elysia marginata]